jgi:hypothetical protein
MAEAIVGDGSLFGRRFDSLGSFRVFRAVLRESVVDFARPTKIRSNFGQSVPTKEKALPRSPRLSAVSRQHKIGQIEVIEEERAFLASEAPYRVASCR